MTIHHRRVPHQGLGLNAGASALDTRVTIGDVTGRVVMVMSDGPDHLLVAVDDARPAKCPRCGHDNPDDPTRTLDGDHAVNVSGPLSYDRLGLDEEANMIRFQVSQPFVIVRCSELDRTLATLQPTFEDRT